MSEGIGAGCGVGHLRSLSSFHRSNLPYHIPSSSLPLLPPPFVVPKGLLRRRRKEMEGIE